MTMVGWHDLRVEPERENLAEIIAWVEAFCKTHESVRMHENHILIVAEELFLNEVSYGGARGGSNGLLFRLLPQPEGAALIMEADGPPFNPIGDVPEPDVDAPLNDRPIGGLGLMLVRKMMDGAEYKRVDGRNILTVVFGRGPIPQRMDGGDKANATAFRWRPRGITFRIVTILSVVMTVGLIAAAELNYRKFKDVLVEVSAARYDPEIRKLKLAIESSLVSGLPLESIRTTQQLIDRSATQFEDPIDLAVRDSEGSILFSTADSGRLQEKPPLQNELVRDFGDPDRFVVHASIMHDGAAVGTLSLSHSAAEAMAALPGRLELHKEMLYPLICVLLWVGVAVPFFGRIEGQFHFRMRAAETGRKLASL
ncbi:ATP-binding protein [Nitratireductor sp. XY-223]|uniref:ATP-binding protein n=1 Tax=Nitratireductor sp. XY-223 TaxID=2561926 RepID=UPI0010A9E771|nr:ATP-binding protein [Nitratireductor sp. XY-223]